MMNGTMKLALAGVVAGALATTAALAQDTVTMLGAQMYGEQEVGHEGAGEDAGGDFVAEIDSEAGTLCYFLDTYGLDDVTAAHVHKAPDGENGPPVVVLEVGADDEVCAEVEAELLGDIAANPDQYYVNVHTAAIPAGAIRGQLGD